jgi:hypothetical protein
MAAALRELREELIPPPMPSGVEHFYWRSRGVGGRAGPAVSFSASLFPDLPRLSASQGKDSARFSTMFLYRTYGLIQKNRR